MEYLGASLLVSCKKAERVEVPGPKRAKRDRGGGGLVDSLHVLQGRGPAGQSGVAGCQDQRRLLDRCIRGAVAPALAARDSAP